MSRKRSKVAEFVALVACALLAFFLIVNLKSSDLNDFANLVRDWIVRLLS